MTIKIYELGYCRHSEDQGVLGLFTDIDMLKKAYKRLKGNTRGYSYVAEHKANVLDVSGDHRHTWDEEDFRAAGIESWPALDFWTE